MTFLSKVGSILVKAAAIIAGVSPLLTPSLSTSAQSMVSTVIDKFQLVVDAVTNAEAVGQALGLSGSQKAVAAAQPISQIALDFIHAKGWQIADETKFKTACTTIAGGVADLMNAVHPDSVQTTNVAKS